MKIIDFFIRSSANPQEVSTSIVGAGMFVFPFLIQLTGLVCQFGYTCITIDPSLWETLVEGVANVFYSVTFFIASFMTVYGVVRKIYRTATGTNKVLM